MAEISLIVKKSQNPEGRRRTRQCSYCQKTGHGAGKCDANPHRNTRCPRCQKWGHSEATFRAKIAPEQRRMVAISEARTETAGERAMASSIRQVRATATNQISVARKESNDEVLAAMKRTADGKALPKQPRGEEEVPFGETLNPVPLRLPPVLSRILFPNPPTPDVPAERRSRRTRRVSKNMLGSTTS